MSDQTSPRAQADHDLAGVFTRRSGVVTAFDDHVGAGQITDAETGESWYFHCTSIHNQVRSVAVGTSVIYRAEPGPTGMEAMSVVPVAPCLC